MTIDRQRFEIRENKWFLQQILANIPAPDHLNELLGHLQCFFQRPTKERWKRLRARHNVQFLKDSSVTLASEWPTKLFQHGRFASKFCFQWKAFIMCAIVSVSQLKLSFSNTCQMTVKFLALHLFPVPQTGSHNNKNQILDG